jgi:hypothetical protein
VCVCGMRVAQVYMHVCLCARVCVGKKTQERDAFDHTIQETQNAYMKIVDSSNQLLDVLAG